MRRATVSVLALALILCGSSVAWAKCPSGQILKRTGLVASGDGIITTNGQDVHTVVVDCSGTACTAGLYDADTLGEATEANLVFEASAGANGTITLDFTENPISFTNGVTFIDDANVDSVVLLSCQPR